MKQPVTTLWKLLLLALTMGTSYRSWGQTYSQVPLTASSFTADIIANGAPAVPPATVTTSEVEGVGSYYLMSQDYYTATTTHPVTTYTLNGTSITQSSGLPNSGLIPNYLPGYAALTYQLASYSANNSLRLAGVNTGTVTFATPTAASEVYVLATSGSAASTVNVTVNYSDGTTSTFTGQNSLTYPDWFTVSTTQNVFGMLARSSTAIPVPTTNNTTGPPFLDQAKLTIPANKINTTISSITFANTTAASYLQIMAVSIGTYPICSVAPSNLATTATTTSGGTTALTSACSSTNIFLSVTGLPNLAGYTYQWQSSTTSATTGFTNITGATSSTYTATGQTATTYYRVQVACLYDGTGGALVNSTPVQVTQSPVTSCYCVPTHTSTSTSYTTINSVSLPGDATTLANAPGLLTSASPGYVSAYYAQYPASAPTTTTLSVNTPYTLSVSVPGFTRASAWIDFDQNGTFDTNEFFILRTGTAVYGSTTPTTLTATITLPATTLPGTTRLRIRTDYYPNTVLNTYAGSCGATTYGESLDYIITVATPVACTGTPPATTATASATGVCTGTGFTLGVTGITPGTTGLSYQWQSAPAGTTTFTNLGAAQASGPYAVTGITAATDYRVVVTCTASGASSTSSVVSVALNYLNCYCTPVSTGTGEYIKSVSLPGTPGFTNASNANTAGYGDYTTTAGLTTTLTQGASYVNGATFIVHSNNTNSQGGIWIDYDHSGTFDASEFTLMGTSSAINTDVTFQVTLTVPTTALTGQTRVRVRWRNGAVAATDACTTGASVWYGETEDYFITIAASTNCTAPPTTVTATADVTNACANASFNLSTSSVPATLGGFTYQWQSRTGTNAFANIAGATTNPYTVTSQTVATDYQLVVSCQFGGTPVTSNIVSVGQNTVNQCYCTASSTNVCSNYGVITSVAVGTIANASGCTSTNSYSDYTNLSTNLAAGSTTTLTLGVASATTTFNYNYGVWIDFNQNGTFEASEFIANSTAAVSATSTSITLTIPALSSTVLAGPTRLRIRTNAGIASYGIFSATGANSACGAVYNGETEDYTVNIVTCTPSTATFSYGPAAPSYCVSGTTNPTVTLATGATAGTFSSTTGLTLNATTGAITLSSSTPGTYAVTNTVAGNGTQCASSATATVTITAAPTAGFSYAGSPYCIGGPTNPTVTLASGAVAGTFTSTPGLTINGATGAITLNSSSIGTYTVTNTVAAANGCAAVTSTATVTISPIPVAGLFSYPAMATCVGTTTTLTPTLTPGGTPGTFTLPTATGLTINATTGVVTVGATAAVGTYTVTNTVAASGGCAGSFSTATFTIAPATTATFSYAAGPYCTSGTTNPTPTITGTTGGTFSSTTGLSINATTGVITLSSSTAGTYTVTYTVAGTCGSSSTQTVTITAPQTAGFSYNTIILGATCAGSANAIAPTMATGATMGTFSSTTGLTVNATTGVINLATSTAGTYTVTNTVAASGGCAAVTTTTTFTANAVPAAPTLTVTGTPATGITLTSSATANTQFYLNGVAIPGATSQSLLINSGTKNGTYTAVAISTAGCISAASAPVTVTVTATAPAATGASLTLYPNPTRDGLLTLELSNYREAVSLSVVNALGQRVYAGTVSGNNLSQQQTLNLSALPSGIYLLQARTASGSVETRRIARE